MNTIARDLPDVYDNLIGISSGKTILNGTLMDMSTASMLQLVKISDKSGILRLMHSNRQAEIAVYKNFIITASSPEDILFGEYLINEGYLTDKELIKALSAQKKSSQKIGVLLKDTGIFGSDPFQLKKILNRYLREVMYRIMKWNQGRFEFQEISEEELVRRYDLSVKMNMDFLLLESSQRMDDWKGIAGNVSSLESALRLNRKCIEENQSLSLNYDEIQVLSYVNGRRSIVRILEKIGHNEMHFLNVINQMIQNRVVIEKQVEAMKLVVPGRISADRSNRELQFPSNLQANLLYKEIDNKKNLYELGLILEFELPLLWESLMLLIKCDVVEIIEGRRDFHNLSEEM
jgi:hypothetical protein